nr:transmembrane protein 120B isoform X5 [Kogia breviceps]
MAGQLERCEREWHELEGEFQELQDAHRIYKQKLEELTALQTSCSSFINKQKTRLKDLKHTLQRYKRHASREEAELVQQLGANIKERQNIFFDMEAYLPKKNGIKGWWVSHHYVSTFLSGVMLTWPNGLIYQKFRDQFLAFSIFQSCVQFLQYYYQRGCLYRLRALGERNHLDLTVEGFQSWMWRGLTFLLPFLFCGHVSPPGVCGYPLHWADLPGTEGLQGSPSLTSHPRAGPHGGLGLPKARAGIGPGHQHAQPQVGCPSFTLGGCQCLKGS